MRYATGICIFVSSLVLLIRSNGDLMTFWDTPTFAFITVGSISLLIAHKSLDDIRGLKPEVIHYFQTCLDVVGSLGAIIGFVQMLHNFSDPKAIGPAMAVCLLSVFYSQVLRQSVKSPVQETKQPQEILLSLGLVVSSFFILILAGLRPCNWTNLDPTLG